MTNPTPFNVPTLTAEIYLDNQISNSGTPNIVLFRLTLNGAPLQGSGITVTLPEPLLFASDGITDQNGEYYLNITSTEAGAFQGTAYMTGYLQSVTPFTTTFSVPYPITIKNELLHFNTNYYAIGAFINNLSLTMDHRYRVTLSRSFNYVVCNENNTQQVAFQIAPTSAAACGNIQPHNLQELNENGLYFRALNTGNSNSMYGRFRYRFDSAGMSVVTVEDFGPSPHLLYQ